ncbi:hypothetical protein RF11_06391 [Thelohanellus kitauei]|uniref:Uncharacterized protein n=1 Tax=Thelohanellus kitauei TaxID=669202 RepID=A0A0C2MLX4_THEKT|nr:hypothetical protein RF11_06391 [Thelohanellus kitauei]
MLKLILDIDIIVNTARDMWNEGENYEIFHNINSNFIDDAVDVSNFDVLGEELENTASDAAFKGDANKADELYQKADELRKKYKLSHTCVITEFADSDFGVDVTEALNKANAIYYEGIYYSNYVVGIQFHSKTEKKLKELKKI